jgi:hypothetical protein
VTIVGRLPHLPIHGSASLIELFQQRGPLIQPVQRDVRDCRRGFKPVLGSDSDIGIRHHGSRSVRRSGITQDFPNPRGSELGPNRVIRRTKETTEWTRASGASLRSERKGEAKVPRNDRGLGILLLSEMVHDRTHERPVPGIARIRFHGDVRDRRRGCREGHPMHRMGVSQRANNGDSVQDLRDPRKDLADPHARDRRSDGPQFSPDFDRSVRFRVECLELAGRSPQIQQNAAFGLAEAGQRRGGGCLNGRMGRQIGQRQPKGGKSPRVQEFSSRDLM